jgi:mannose-6-phosphate isomerase-like protein (cupin superfamily)
VAVVGGSVENPVNGERIEWVETAASTSGERLCFDLHLEPGAAVAASHRHLGQEEHFQVRAGALGVEVAGQEASCGPGEEVLVPPSVVHRWWNAGTGEAIVRVTLRPALRSEAFFETFFGLAREGKTNERGIPGLLQTAVTLHELGESCPYLARPSVGIQRMAAAILAPIGRSAGRRPTYESYGPRGETPAT